MPSRVPARGLANIFSMGENFEERAKERRATLTARIARSPQEAAALERDRENALLPFERAEAIWSVVRDLTAARGNDGSELRLNRSLARVKRRGR